MSTATNSQKFEEQSSTDKVGFLALFRAYEPPCVSIFLKTESGMGATDRNFKRLKELLQNAEAQLSKAPIGLVETADLFAPALSFAQQVRLNPHTEGGIGLFLARNFFRHFVLTGKQQDHVAIGRRFFIRPMLRYLANDHFFLLALSQDHVKLFQGTAEGLKELYVTGVPENLRQDFETQSFERESEFHTASPAIAGKLSAIFHGSQPQQKDKILHFFRNVNEGIASRLKGQSAPLVLAAVHYLMPIYHRVNSYPHLLDEGIFGNPDIQAEELLHSAARIILNTHSERERDSVLKVYTESINTGITSSNLRDVVVAAVRGRIRFLLVPEDTEQWGTFDSPDVVHVHAQREAGDDELLNLAVVSTLRNGGKAFIAPKDFLPEGASLAAVFRFA
jgi:hypothetical protein